MSYDIGHSITFSKQLEAPIPRQLYAIGTHIDFAYIGDRIKAVIHIPVQYA